MTLVFNIAACLVIVLALIRWYFVWTFDYWSKRGIPSLKPTMVVGNFGNWAFLKMDAGNMFRVIYNQTKQLPLVGIWVFRRPALVVNSPELIKAVLVRDFAHFADRSTHCDRNYDPIGSDNLFFGKNPHWKIMRTKLTQLYSSSKMRSMFHLVNEIGCDLEEHIARSNGEPIEMKETAAKFTTDVIATTAYGLKANTLSDDDAPFNSFRKRLLDFRWIRAIKFISIFFLQSLAKMWRSKVFEDDCADWMRKVFWNTVKEREKTQENRSDLIGTLIALKNSTEKNDNELVKFTGDSLVAQAAIFFTAGNESSSTTMSFLLYELALQPKIQEKLATEVLQVLKKYNNEITYECINDMPYLDMCFKETLRKYPPLPFLDRECTKSYTFPGTTKAIEKGTIVYVPMMGLQWDPNFFPNPETFDPERFNKENIESIQPFTFFPFGEGPRICIGERFGSMQSRIGMVHIMKRFIINKCSLTKEPLTWLTLTLSPTTKDGIYLQFLPRLEADL